MTVAVMRRDDRKMNVKCAGFVCGHANGSVCSISANKCSNTVRCSYRDACRNCTVNKTCPRSEV